MEDFSSSNISMTKEVQNLYKEAEKIADIDVSTRSLSVADTIKRRGAIKQKALELEETICSAVRDLGKLRIMLVDQAEVTRRLELENQVKDEEIGILRRLVGELEMLVRLLGGQEADDGKVDAKMV